MLLSILIVKDELLKPLQQHRSYASCARPRSYNNTRCVTRCVCFKDPLFVASSHLSQTTKTHRVLLFAMWCLTSLVGFLFEVIALSLL